MKSTTLFALAIASTIGLTNPALAGPEINTARGAVLVAGKVSPGLAVHGFDVVAFFTKSKPVQGDANFAVVHNEATYRFSSEANLDAFKADPARYEPAFGGYCAYGVSVGAKFDGDPRYWKVIDGKLYLNLDANIQKAFLKDIPGALKKAEANWSKLADKDPSLIN